MQSLTTHNAIKNVGARRIGNKTYRKGNILLNQVLSGHTRLNCMEIHTNPECETDKCEQCKRPETIDHYLWDCCKYEKEREELERETYMCLKEEDQLERTGSLEIYSGTLEEISREGSERLQKAMMDYILETKRF